MEYKVGDEFYGGGILYIIKYIEPLRLLEIVSVKNPLVVMFHNHGAKYTINDIDAYLKHGNLIRKKINIYD